MNYLLDTCIISEYLKKQPSQSVTNWVSNQSESTLYLSCLTIAELKKGYYKTKSQKPTREHIAKAQKISTWIQGVESRFSSRLINLDSDVLNTWAVVCGKLAAEGRPLSVIDSLIAATAYQHKITVVTRNVKDFEPFANDLNIFNPY